MANLEQEFRNTLRHYISDTWILERIDSYLDDVRKFILYDIGNKEYLYYLQSPIPRITEPIKVLTGSDITVRTIKQVIAKYDPNLVYDKHMFVSVIFDTKPLKTWSSRVSKKIYHDCKLFISDNTEHIGEFIMEMDKIPSNLPIKQVVIIVL